MSEKIFFEPAQIILAAPGKRLLYELNGVDESSVQINRRTNKVHSISFTVNKYVNGNLSNGYDWIDEQMELYCDGTWFVINTPPSIEYDSYQESKRVTAESLECRLQQYILNTFAVNQGVEYSYEMMYKAEHPTDEQGNEQYYQVKFYNPSEPQLSFLHLVLAHAEVPEWTIGYVDNITVNPADNTTLLPNEIVNFDVGEKSVYALLTQDAAAAARCIFEFDTINMKINVYRPESLGKDTNVIIDFHNVQNSLSINRLNPLITSFNVTGNDINIDYVNPVGGSIIEDLTQLANDKFMGKTLADKYLAWIKLRDSYVEPYMELSKKYHNLLTTISELYNRVPSDTIQNDYHNMPVEDLKIAYNSAIAIVTALENKYKDVHGNLDIESLKSSVDWELYKSTRDYTIPSIVSALQGKQTEIPDNTGDYGFGNLLKNPVPISFGNNSWSVVGSGNFKCVTLTEQPDYGMTSALNVKPKNTSGIEQTTIQTTVDTKYCLSVYVKTTTNMTVNLQFGVTLQKNKRETKSFKINAGSWQRIYAVFTAENKLSDVAFTCSGNGEVMFTGMMLEIGNAPTSFSYYKLSDTELKSYETDWKLYGIDELNTKLGVYQNSIDILTENGYNEPYAEDTSKDEPYHIKMHQQYLDYVYLRDCCQAALNERKSEVKPYEKERDALQSQRVEINELLRKENFGTSQTVYSGFTNEELVCLSILKNQNSYSNPNIIVTSIDTLQDEVDIQKRLYDDAMDQLYVESHYQYEYSDSIDNILDLPEFAVFQGELDINNFIRVGIDDEDTYVKLRVIEMIYNPCMRENDLRLVFSNVVSYRSKVDDLAYLINEVPIASSRGQIVGSGTNETASFFFTPELISQLVSNPNFQSSLGGLTVGGAGYSGSAGFATTGGDGSTTVTVDTVISALVKAEQADFNSITSDTGFFKYLDTTLLSADTVVAKIAELEEAHIETLFSDTVFSDKIVALSSATAEATIDSAYITDIVASEMTIADLKAGDITLSDSMRILSENGMMIMDGTVLQIMGTDTNGDNYVGIQLGYDATDKPSLILRNEDGEIVLQPSGITDKAIADGLIKNNMVGEGEISKEKLDFKVTTNDEGSVTVTIHEVIDEEGKTLGDSYTQFKKDMVVNNKAIANLQTNITSVFDLENGSIKESAFQKTYLYAPVLDENGDYTYDEDGNIIKEKDAYSIIDRQMETIRGFDKLSSTLTATSTELGNLISTAQQTADKFYWLVKDDSTSSSLSLTSAALEAVTDQFIVKSPDGQRVIISNGTLTADSLKSNNYQYTSGIFADAGTYYNLTTGELTSKNFSIDSNGEVHVNGTINALSGNIGGCSIVDGKLQVPSAYITGTLSTDQLDLIVGGRNFVLNSNIEQSVTNNVIKYELSEYGINAIRGNEITVSLDAKSDIDALNIDVYVCSVDENDAESIVSDIKMVTINDVYQRYVLTLNVANIDNIKYVVIRSNGSVNGGSTTATAYVTNIKVELGNISTSYIVAPEDTDNSIKDAQITANTVNNIIAEWCHKNNTTLIDGSKIYTGSITALGNVTAGSFNLGNGKFKVDSDGTLSCTGATINGTVNASEFTLQGAKISLSELYVDYSYIESIMWDAGRWFGDEWSSPSDPSITYGTIGFFSNMDVLDLSSIALKVSGFASFEDGMYVEKEFHSNTLCSSPSMIAEDMSCCFLSAYSAGIGIADIGDLTTTHLSVGDVSTGYASFKTNNTKPKEIISITLPPESGTLLNTANYSSYALPKKGGTLTGDLVLDSSTITLSNNHSLKGMLTSGESGQIALITTANHLSIGKGISGQGRGNTNVSTYSLSLVPEDDIERKNALFNVYINDKDSEGTRIGFAVGGHDSYGNIDEFSDWYNTTVRAPAIYNNTTGSAANVFISSTGGMLQRSTSASKYKLNIQGVQEDSDYFYNILKLNPQQWNDKGSVERYSKYLTRKVNGEEIDPNEDFHLRNIDISPIYGLIAEQVEESGLNKFCVYDENENSGKVEIEGIQYDRLWINLIPIVRDLILYTQKTASYIDLSTMDRTTRDELSTLLERINSFKEEAIIS